jgi:hypothetical protein
VTTDYNLYWNWDLSSRTFITTTTTDIIGHFEGVTYTVPITAMNGIYTVTAQVETVVGAAALFEVP